MCLLEVKVLHGSISPMAKSVMDEAFSIGIWQEKQEVSLGSANKRHSAAASQHVSVNLVGRTGVQLTVRPLNNMFSKDSLSYSGVIAQLVGRRGKRW